MNTRKIISVLFLTLAVLSALAMFRENNPTPTASSYSKNAKGGASPTLQGQ